MSKLDREAAERLANANVKSVVEALRRAEPGHCRDCRHFATDMSYSRREGWAACNLTGSDGGEAECDKTLAYARDFEAYSAWLEVSPDFGCVQFEPKEQG